MDTGGGYIVLLADNTGVSAPLAWVANKIRCNVGSTLAAECLILLKAVDHSYYLRGLLAEIVNWEASYFKLVAIGAENAGTWNQVPKHIFSLQARFPKNMFAAKIFALIV